MRKRVTRQGISVQAISGTYTVMLGFNATEEARIGLLGFAIRRSDHTENERYWLRGFKTFASVIPEPKPGDTYPLFEQPVQSFLWGDYTAKPAHDYTYEVTALYGQPKNLLEGPRVAVRIRTERENRGKHVVYFIRGVSGSQAYAWKFGNKTPDEVPNRRAYTWLSRGLEEALLGFIAQADGPTRGLRASVYEFNYPPVLAAFKAAYAAGADVKIIYDARQDPPVNATREAIDAVGLPQEILIARTAGRSYISHNKFIVLLKRNQPVQVWTGSTNLTRGGIFGQANVGHLVRDSRLARQYLDYWTLLAGDPANKDLRPLVAALTPDPLGAPDVGTTPVFSPRPGLGALAWFAERVDAAQQTAALTAAFGVNPLMAAVFNRDRDFARFLLLEKRGENYDVYAADPDVQVSIGSHLGQDPLYQWAAERLTGFNLHVRYIHTKFLLVDPLGDDPLVVTGSGNFSGPSITDNDENMLVIRGDRRVADIYLGEFMRLFNHFYFRYHASRLEEKASGQPSKGLFLVEDDSWTNRYYNPASPKYKLRVLFG
ncbi:MAG TPA: phospholipase D-like domain-containing protein [Anaerolinea sp.]|nr:phospholipase D-like domain-containing protein [Anaerolinea sp.]